ncbi:hypothetical protein ES703_88249 [subsurface metagenome]
MNRDMWNSKGDVEKEPSILIIFNKFQSVVGHKIVGILSLPSVFIPFEHMFLIVAPKVSRIITVCLSLAIVSIEIIKPLFVWLACSSRASKPPLSYGSSGIARLLKDRRQSLCVWRQRTLPFLCWVLPSTHFIIIPDITMPGVLSSKQSAAGRRAYRASRVVLSEFYSLRCQLVYVWRSDLLLPITAQFTITQVICKNVNNIWPAGRTPAPPKNITYSHRSNTNAYRL